MKHFFAKFAVLRFLHIKESIAIVVVIKVGTLGHFCSVFVNLNKFIRGGVTLKLRLGVGILP